MLIQTNYSGIKLMSTTMKLCERIMKCGIGHVYVLPCIAMSILPASSLLHLPLELTYVGNRVACIPRVSRQIKQG